jgi:hypothetical protein
MEGRTCRPMMQREQPQRKEQIRLVAVTLQMKGENQR